jgi:hypothetical protein
VVSRAPGVVVVDEVAGVPPSKTHPKIEQFKVTQPQLVLYLLFNHITQLLLTYPSTIEKVAAKL